MACTAFECDVIVFELSHPLVFVLCGWCLLAGIDLGCFLLLLPQEVWDGLSYIDVLADVVGAFNSQPCDGCTQMAFV